jgi:CheY-like chemotaxis protein
MEVLRQVLQSLRAHVLVARNIEAAEHELAFQRPHLIICGMKLPDGAGTDFIKWLRAQPRIKGIPSIAITGLSNTSLRTLR